jgi:hypothetical protein
VRLAILSDGSFPDPSSEALELPVHFQRVGTPRPNVAISGLDIRRGLKDPQLIELFVELQNFGQEPVAGNLNVFLNQTQLDTKYFTIEAGQSRSQIFEADLPEGGDVRLELDVKDALAADNQAWQVVAPPKPRRVLLVGRPSYFLERVFRASQTVAVDTLPSAPDDATAAGYSAVLWNRVEQPGIAPTHNLYLGCFPTVPGLVTKPTVKNPAVVDWDNGHPINRFNDYSDLLLPEAIPMVLPEQGRPLLSSADFPLIALLQHERHALVILGFDPFTSNWPLLVSFPIFLHNCLGYFDTLGAQAANSNQLVGRTIVCPPVEPAPVLILPSGERVTLQRQGNADYAYSRVDRCGVYRLELDGQVTRTIAVNLFNPAESLLTPNEQPPLGANVATTGDLTQRVNREFTRPLLYAALGLLLLEFVFFHRRWLR